MNLRALRRPEASEPGLKVVLRLDPAIAAVVHRDLIAGRATSLNDWVNEAARLKVRSDALTALLADLLEHTGGPLTAHEVDHAREQLGGELFDARGFPEL